MNEGDVNQVPDEIMPDGEGGNRGAVFTVQYVSFIT